MEFDVDRAKIILHAAFVRYLLAVGEIREVTPKLKYKNVKYDEIHPPIVQYGSTRYLIFYQGMQKEEHYHMLWVGGGAWAGWCGEVCTVGVDLC